MGAHNLRSKLALAALDTGPRASFSSTHTTPQSTDDSTGRDSNSYIMTYFLADERWMVN